MQRGRGVGGGQKNQTHGNQTECIASGHTHTHTHRNVVVSGWGEVGDGASVARWQHQLVLYQRVLKHHAVDIAARQVTADLEEEETCN